MSIWPDPFAQSAGASWANGITGSLTPSSQTNASAQKGSSGNPFTDVLNQVSAFNSAYGSPVPPAQNTPGTGPVGGAYGPPPTSPVSGGMGSFATPVPSAPSLPTWDPTTGQWLYAKSYSGAAPAFGTGQQVPPTRATPSTPPNAVPVPSLPSEPTWDPNTQTWLYAKSYSGGGDGPSGPGDGPENRLPDGGGGTGTNPPPDTTTTTPTNPPPGNAQQPPPGTRGNRPRPTDPVTSHNDWLHFDSTGKAWGNDNLPPKPQGTEDPAVAARWYSQFNFLDPSLVNVTPADVQAFRTSGYNPTEEELSTQPGMLRSAFLAWWQHGKPTPAQNPQPTPGGPTNPNGWVDPSTNAPQAPRRGVPPPSPGGTTPGAGDPGTAPPPAAGTPPPGTTPPPTTGTPPPAGPPAPPATPDEQIQKLIDLYSKTYAGQSQPGIESMLNPMFARQRQNAINDINAAGAALGPGVLESGGFGANRNQAISDITGQQSGVLADAMSKEYLAKLEQNTKFAELATTAGMQKYVTDINNDLQRYQINTNADLQKWLDTQDNALKKYGIDTNDVLERYKANLELQGVKYSADASVQAASLHAAATQAAAAASSAASLASAQLNYQLGMSGLQVDRERNIGQFILGVMGLGQGNLDNLGNILSNFPGGSFVWTP